MRTPFHGERPHREIVTSSNALVTRFDAIVTSSFLLLSAWTRLVSVPSATVVPIDAPVCKPILPKLQTL